jgi:hypothetical protein
LGCYRENGISLLFISALSSGHAFAGGAFLALAHDYIVMQTEKGWISANEIFLGLKLGDFFTALYRSETVFVKKDSSVNINYKTRKSSFSKHD